MKNYKITNRYMYTAINTEIGMVKVGISKDPDMRMKSLNTCQVPGSYVLLATKPANYDTEAAFHKLADRKFGHVHNKQELYTVGMHGLRAIQNFGKAANYKDERLSETFEDGDVLTLTANGVLHKAKVCGDEVEYYGKKLSLTDWCGKITKVKTSISDAKNNVKYKGATVAQCEALMRG